ncbi:MAG TPA: DUF5908 family protein [Sphingomicrobium sp.]|nr:DUF5908 family protein [Sphingomicrobium sp.]
MPIEIRELVIRAVVEPPHRRSGAASPMAEEDRATLVQQCVDEVQKALRRARER